MEQATTFKYNSVMVIDDDAIHSFITEHLLKGFSFSKEVIAYANPLEALNYLSYRIHFLFIPVL